MRDKGITLIALIVTIIVLLILAGATLNLTVGNNGIIGKAREARTAMEIAQERGNVNMAAEAAYMNWPYIGIKEEDFAYELNKLIGEGKYILDYDAENKIYTVTYKESKRSYTVENTEVEEKEKTGNLKIKTQITEFAKNLGNVQISYNIKAESNGKEIYNNIESVSCDDAGEKVIQIENIPIGATVTVISVYNTQSYQLKSDKNVTLSLKDEVTNVNFLYEYDNKMITSDSANVSLNYDGTKVTRIDERTQYEE